MQSIYAKWLNNRGKTEWSENPIKRLKYCMHEYRWMLINGYPKIYAIKHWVLVYFGIKD